MESRWVAKRGERGFVAGFWDRTVGATIPMGGCDGFDPEDKFCGSKARQSARWRPMTSDHVNRKSVGPARGPQPASEPENAGTTRAPATMDVTRGARGGWSDCLRNGLADGDAPYSRERRGSESLPLSGRSVAAGRRWINKADGRSRFLGDLWRRGPCARRGQGGGDSRWVGRDCDGVRGGGRGRLGRGERRCDRAGGGLAGPK